MKVTVHFADGATDEHVLKNGEHFADTFARAEVPLSADAGDFTRRGQLRYFAVNLGRRGRCRRSCSRASTPTSCRSLWPSPRAPSRPPQAQRSAAGQGQALRQARDRSLATQGTGPKEGGKGDAPLPETKPIVWAAGKTKVLIIGGGSSHNFGQFFGGTDGATLQRRRLQRQLHRGSRPGGRRDRQCRRRRHQRQPAVLRHARSAQGGLRFRRSRQGAGDAASRARGTGLRSWPELNATIVGGGSRGHDRSRPFGQRGEAGTSRR